MAAEHVATNHMETEAAAPKREGAHSMIYLYVGFFTVPGGFMALMANDPSFPVGMVGLMHLFGVMFTTYGLYKALQHVVRTELVDVTQAPYVGRFLDLIDRLRYVRA